AATDKRPPAQAQADGRNCAPGRLEAHPPVRIKARVVARRDCPDRIDLVRHALKSAERADPPGRAEPAGRFVRIARKIPVPPSTQRKNGRAASKSVRGASRK